MAHYTEKLLPLKNLDPIFFRRWKPEKPEMTVICVHGAGGNSSDFTKLAEALSSDHDRCPMDVIAFDAPGNGLSNHRIGVSPFKIQLFMIEHLVRRAEFPVAVVASSAGALASFIVLHAMGSSPTFSEVPVVFAEPAFGVGRDTVNYIEKCRPFLHGQFADMETAMRTWDLTPLGGVLFDSELDKLAFIRGRLKVSQSSLIAAARSINLDPKKFLNVLENSGSFPNPCCLMWGELSDLMGRYEKAFDRISRNSEKIVFPGAGHPLSDEDD